MNFTIVGLFFLVGIFLITTSSSLVYGEEYQSNEKPIPNWIRHAASLWVSGEISDDEYKNMLENLLNQNILENIFDEYDISYTINDGIYKKPSLNLTNKIILSWNIPEEIKKNSVQTQLKIITPEGKETKKTVYGNLVHYTLTHKSPVGIYTIKAKYGNTPIDIPSFEVVKKLPKSTLPLWVKSTAKWWSQEQISDIQFLKSVHYMKHLGLINFNPNYNLKQEIVEDPGIEILLPTNEEVFHSTIAPTWEIIENGIASKNDLEGVTDSARIIVKDITRVYEPIFYKNKVPSIVMEVYEFDNKKNLQKFWNVETDEQYNVFDTSYMVGSLNDADMCFFDYNNEGAISGCIVDKMIIQVMIFDQSNSHYSYKKENLTLDEYEPTTKFMSMILDKINQKYDNISKTTIHQTMQPTVSQTENVSEVLQKNNMRVLPKTTEPESAYVEGIERFSCNRNDFGVITIIGEYNNGDSKKDQVGLIISFIDHQGNINAKSSINLHEIQEYESRKFLGHTKWNGNFYTCNITLN